VLELIPSAVFLSIMHPSSSQSHKDDATHGADESVNAASRKVGTIRRVDSASSGHSAHGRSKTQETTGLLKTSVGYGSTDAK
jgi:hypothetical protein